MTTLRPTSPSAPGSPTPDDGVLTLHRDAGGVEALRRAEWLLTNGTGGYAMGTALGVNTRRYHGLLVAAATPPVGRVVVLSQVVDELILHGTGVQPDQRLDLSSLLFRSGEDIGLIHAPGGYASLERCDRAATVRWTYTLGPVRVTRDLTLHDGEPAATLSWSVSGWEGRATLRVTPLLPLRDFHALDTGLNAQAYTVQAGADTATVTRGEHTAELVAQGAGFESGPDVWRGAVYPRETFRGQDDHEDLFTPGCFVFDLPGQGADLRGGALQVRRVESTPGLGPEAAAPRGVRQDAAAEALAAAGVPHAQTLARAADSFVVSRERGGQALSTVIAGYPWFADWGRDTFIALPGLMLTTGRHEEAGRTLRAFADALRDGLVPNRFDDYDPTLAHYNTVDGSMWFVNAALAYFDAVKEAGESAEPWLLDAVRAVVDAHLSGTAAQDHGGRPIPIAVGDDGLIVAGDDHTQLTWMDAACGGEVFTPRPGRCVEINALWYSALTGLAQRIADLDPQASQAYAKQAQRVAAGFQAAFEGGPGGGLIDHVRPDGTPSTELRPNQIIACALERSPLSDAARAGAVAAVREHLLTPVGLRTLAPGDGAYRPHYGGDQMSRDSAYHQGTVWPWPLGSYAEAVLRVGDFSPAARREAQQALSGLHVHLCGAGFGQIHEIFDAEPGTDGTHGPRGCPAQAWSVSELIRVSALCGSA